MKTKTKLFLFVVIVYSISLLVQSCATPVIHPDYAVRIKKDSVNNYQENRYTKAFRNGSTLRGQVLGISVITQPDSCPIKSTTKFTTKRYVQFVDSMSTYDSQIESIPLEAVDLIGFKLDSTDKDYGKINLFEEYNYPLNPKKYHEVPIEYTTIDNCSDCGCNKLNINLPNISLPSLRFKCPKRNCGWYFLELRGVYSVYNDFNIKNTKIGKDNLSAEIAAGIRFGAGKKIGLGVAVSNGIKAYDTKRRIDLTRPSVMLHLRYDFFTRCNKTVTITETTTEETGSYKQDPCDICEKEKEFRATTSKKINILRSACIRPFVYGQLGGTIDDPTIELFKLNFSADCKNKLSINGDLPGFDFGIPISYTLGAGLDIPIVSWLDLSADLSFRSYAIGELTELLSYSNVPVKRTINMLVFRFGVTF